VATSRAAAAARTGVRTWREPHELALIAAARNGDERAMDELIRRYHGFVRLKASSYFLAGGDSSDLIQEGLVGLFKAVRDFRSDKETSFRSFAELCITRQIITAIKTATRFKHAPLNTYVSFSHTPAGQDLDADCTLGDALPGPAVDDPATCVISSDELQSLLECLGSTLSPLDPVTLGLCSQIDLDFEVERASRTATPSAVPASIGATLLPASETTTAAAQAAAAATVRPERSEQRAAADEADAVLAKLKSMKGAPSKDDDERP